MKQHCIEAGLWEIERFQMRRLNEFKRGFEDGFDGKEEQP